MKTFVRTAARLSYIFVMLYIALPSHVISQNASPDSNAVDSSAVQSREARKRMMLPELDNIRNNEIVQPVSGTGLDSTETDTTSASGTGLDSTRTGAAGASGDSIALIGDSLTEAIPDSIAGMAAEDSLVLEEQSLKPDTSRLVALIVIPEHLDVITDGVEKFIGVAVGRLSPLIPNSAFTWSSSIDGILGNGKDLVVAHLTRGVHKIRLGITLNGAEISKDSIYCVVMDQYVDIPPEVVNRPPLAGSTGQIFGEIIVGVLLNEAGGVARAELVENTTGNDSLAQYYISRTREMTFAPAREKDIQKEVWIANSLYFDGVEAPDEIIAAAPELLLAIRREEIAFLGSQGSRSALSGGAQLDFTREVTGNSQKAETYMFPRRLLSIPMRLKKNNESLSGELAAVIKINRMGLVKELLILENTTSELWIEEDFIESMVQSVFEPMYDPAGPNDRLIHSVFKIQGENIIPVDIGGESAWKERYQYRFPSIETGEEPDFSREPKVRVAAGYFRLKLSILPSGSAADIKEIEKNINEGDLKDLARDTYKKNKYIPAQVNGKPKTSYLFPLFSFENYDNNYYLRLLRPYNNGYYYHLNRDYKKALGNFEDLTERDLSGEILGMYGQYAHCAERINKYKEAFRNYERAIRKFASMKKLPAVDRLAIEYETLKKGYRSNTPFYKLLYGGFNDLYAYHTFMPEASLPRIKGMKNIAIQKVEFPDDVRKTGAEGTVYIAAMIDNNGMVKETGVQKSFGSFECEKDALKQVKKQDYDAATIGTDPITSWVSIPARYRYASPIYQPDAQALPLQTVQRPDSLYIKPGLPQLMMEGPNEFSKTKKETNGYLRTALKFNQCGWVTDILFIENTITNDREKAEEDLVKLLSGSLFDPRTIVKDSSNQVVYVATFVIKDKQFALPEDTRLALFLDKKTIVFPKAQSGTEPDFQASGDIEKAIGAFNVRFMITGEGMIDKIETPYKEINKGKLVDIAKKAFEQYTFTPGQFGDSLKTAYKLFGYGWNTVDFKKQAELVKIYDDGYKKLIKNDYSGAAKKFREVILKDKTGDFYGLIPQMLYCFKQAGEVRNGYMTVNNLLRFYSFSQDTTMLYPLVKTYSALRYHAAVGNDFYAVISDSSDPKKLFSLPERDTEASLLSDVETLWQQVEYPKKKREEMRWGTVEIMALINEKSEIKSLELLHSLGDGDYDNRAKDAVKDYARFSNAVYNGTPVPYWCKVPIKFEKPLFPEDMIPWWNEPDEAAPPDSIAPVDSVQVVSGDTTVSMDPDGDNTVNPVRRSDTGLDSSSAFLLFNDEKGTAGCRYAKKETCYLYPAQFCQHGHYILFRNNRTGRSADTAVHPLNRCFITPGKDTV